MPLSARDLRLQGTKELRGHIRKKKKKQHIKTNNTGCSDAMLTSLKVSKDNWMIRACFQSI